MNNFEEDGLCQYPNFFDSYECKSLLDEIINTREIGNIFYTQEEFNAQVAERGYNPRPGRNLAGTLNTEFIFGNINFQKEISYLIGKNFRILDYKFVMGIPRSFIPDWMNAELGDALVANLGKYIRKEYRDITYFRGIDYHQDIIDFPYKDSNFITVYIYLDDVDANSSPLNVLPGSHLLGAAIFPHNLEVVGADKFHYKNDYGDSIVVDNLKLTGGGGSMYIWHSNLLHGTQPHEDDSPRISLRILVEKNTLQISDCPLDRVNKKMRGSLALTQTRRDLDEHGGVIKAGNFINKNL